MTKKQRMLMEDAKVHLQRAAAHLAEMTICMVGADDLAHYDEIKAITDGVSRLKAHVRKRLQPSLGPCGCKEDDR